MLIAASKQNEAENLSNLGRTMNKVEAFVRRHPKVYFNYMTLVLFVMGLLAKYLNKTMLHFILMKGLDQLFKLEYTQIAISRIRRIATFGYIII